MGPVMVNRESGALIEITSVDDTWTRYRVLGPLGGSMSIRTSEYDSTFVEQWRPATAEDLAGMQEKVRLPRNADTDEDWAAHIAAMYPAKTP